MLTDGLGKMKQNELGRQKQDQQEGRDKINRKSETRSIGRQKQDQQYNRNKISREAETRSTGRH